MKTEFSCPECGAAWPDDRTCEDHFHQMLFWENENPANGAVHHLAVLCYYIQHPSLYSPEGLRWAMALLRDFVERGLSPAEIIERDRGRVDSGSRAWKFKPNPGSHGAYAHPVTWTMTAADVVAAGIDGYLESVPDWARRAYAALVTSGNLPED